MATALPCPVSSPPDPHHARRVPTVLRLLRYKHARAAERRRRPGPVFARYGSMVDNAPFLTHQHGGLTVEGYSRAAVQSYWRVPELKLGFDLGAQPWDFMGTPTWLVTHTHLDHVAALPVYVARRRMMKMEPPTIYLPESSLEDVRRLLLIMQRLDRGRMICQLNGIKAGDEIELSRELIITPFATTHTIPSLGYVVWDRRLKLK